ncbi:MAG: metal ABC transporter substrate-binding protein [Clostridiales bacterium]|jgi:zinc transport system substrate-binding protein|nr:metal ABC transporter substrate-binding protein [Clostridiales bacterium]
MRKIALVLAVLAMLAMLAGCQGKAAGAGEEVQAADKKLSVIASFYAMEDFAKKIGGDLAEVKNIVPPGVEPHDWEPAAKDIAALEEADVFVYNGAEMEHWVEDIEESLSTGKLVSVEASKGIEIIVHEEHEEDEHEDEEEHEEEEEGHDHGGVDPHVWLSPALVKTELRNIADGYIKADPDNASVYNQNYDKWAAECDALDQEFKDALAPLPNRDVIVAHEAFAYLCASYGLNQEPIEGLSADSEPTPSRVAEIIDFAKEHEIKVVFFEELASPKVSESIAEAIGASTDILSTLEGLSEEQEAAGDDYFSIMRQNLQSLVKALG